MTATTTTAIKDPKQLFEQDSAWYFKRREFKEFIETITDQSAAIETVLDGWRELPILPKDFRKKTVKEVVESQLISQLYEELRNNSKMKPPSKLKLPYKKAVRELELKQNLKQFYNDIDEDRAYSKIVEGHYNGDESTTICNRSSDCTKETMER